MEIIVVLIIFIIGVTMTVKGGDLFVDASIWMAERTGISAAIIGATVVSIATTMPEFFVSTIASTEGLSEMAVGNALGSYICNIALIIGVCALIKPIKISGSFFPIKGMMMVGYLCLFFILSKNGLVGYDEGYLLISLVVFFIILNVLEHKKYNKNMTERKRRPIKARDIVSNGIKFTLGGFFIVYGAHILVDYGLKIALLLKIPKQVVSLTLLAIGTSIPELVTGLTATIKGQQSISTGNILGSNIMNMSVVMGASALVSKQGLIISKQTLVLDLPMAMLVSLIFIITGVHKQGISRLTGGALVGIYIIYLIILF